MYGKIFSTLFHGSLIGQRNAQHVLVFLISHADLDGTVEAHPKEISTLCGIPEPEVLEALEELQAPDPYSRSPEADGRRVERSSDGFTWQIVNYKKYRALRDRETLREQTKERVKRYRNAHVTHGNAPKRHEEEEGEVEEERDKEHTSELPVPTPLWRECQRLSQLLLDLILRHDPKYKPKAFNQWPEHIDKLHRLDGREFDDIEKVIRWCQSDAFWHRNILSTSKLREKFTSLLLAMKEGKNGKPKRDSRRVRAANTGEWDGLIEPAE